MDNIRSYNIMGVEIHPLSIDALHRVIKACIDTRSRVIISSQNLHSVYLYQHDAKLRELQKLALKRVDGMPLILWGKLLGLPLNRAERVTWVDWIDPLLAFAQAHHWRVFYLGSTKAVAAKAGQVLRERYPDLQIEMRDGYFDPQRGSAESAAIVSAINAYAPDVLIVGMGMPRQEYWILDHHDLIQSPAILTSGAAMEYVAGAVSQPPRWMGRMSLEWLYRLLENPSRFWMRYLVEPWSLLGLMMRDLMCYYFTKDRNDPKI
jgi:N-acetylglucosaminyldiphosphoundecaprenol N-acetyl-beta-D-mannosaminyltransferase